MGNDFSSDEKIWQIYKKIPDVASKPISLGFLTFHTESDVKNLETKFKQMTLLN